MQFGYKNMIDLKYYNDRGYHLKLAACRNWTYHKNTFHETMYSSLEEFHPFLLQDQGQFISTDEFDDSIISALAKAPEKLPMYQRGQAFKA